MNLEIPEKRTCVRDICILWTCLNASWTVVRNVVPIILNDIDAATAPLYLGYFISTNAFLATIISLAGGHLSDRYGRLAVLLPWTIYFATTALTALLGDVWRSVGLLWYSRTAAMSVPLTLLNALLSDFLQGNALLEAGGLLGTSQNISVLVATVMCGVVNAMMGRGATMLVGFALGLLSCYFTAKLHVPAASMPLLVVSTDEPMAPVAANQGSTALSVASATTSRPPSTPRIATGAMSSSSGSAPPAPAPTASGARWGTTPDVSGPNSAGKTTALPVDEDADEEGVEIVRRRPGSTDIMTSSRLMWRDPLLRLFALAIAITRMAAMNNNLMSVFFITRRFNWGLSEVSYLLAFASFIGAVTQWKILPILIRRGWVYETLVVSVIVEALAMAALAFATTGLQLYVIHFASGFGAVSGTILNSRLSALGAEKGISGHALGVVGFVQNGGEMFLANIFGAFLAWSMRAFPLQSPLAGLPFIANGVLIFLAFQVINFANYWYGENRLPWSTITASAARTAEERIDMAESGKMDEAGGPKAPHSPQQ